MSEDINVTFCRVLLANVTKEVKKHFPAINLRKDAWVWTGDRRSWEFHGPDKFYWYGNADNAYDARTKGWEAYLSSKGIEYEGEE